MSALAPKAAVARTLLDFAFVPTGLQRSNVHGLALFDHLSACASSAVGTSMPSALAVLRSTPFRTLAEAYDPLSVATAWRDPRLLFESDDPGLSRRRPECAEPPDKVTCHPPH